MYNFHFPPEVQVGYPSSGQGVWLLKYLADSDVWMTWEGEWKPALRRRPYDWGQKMKYVLTMDERCKALEKLGGTFYEKVEICEDISTTFEEATRKGKHYNELLQKMEDFENFIKRVDDPRPS